MKLTLRFGILVFVLLASLGVSAFAGLYSLRQGHRALEIVMKDGNARLLAVTNVRRAFRAMTVEEAGQILAPDDADANAALARTYASRTELADRLSLYGSIMPDADRDSVEALRGAFLRWVEINDRVVALALSHRSGEAYLLAKTHGLDPVSWEKLAARLVEANEARLAIHIATAGDTYRVGRLALLASTTFAAVFALFVGTAVFQRIKGTVLELSTLNANLEGIVERRTRDLEAARAESVEASRAKSDFLANMSHEIRTPMTAVIGYADLLMDPSLDASERVNHLQTIRRNGEHLLTLINDILDVSKLEAGKMSVESIPTSISQVIGDVSSLMRVRALAKNLGFEVQYQGAIPATILSDPTRFKQIVMNFVANAIKFTESGTIRILVRCDRDLADPRMVVDVADTGIGMTEPEIQRLFQSFSQADASTTRKFGGSGLGLLISKRLAGLLGGDVSVESAPGRGTVFRVSIPTGPLAGVPTLTGLSEAGLGDRHSRVVRRAPSLPPSCRILLAEDGHDNQILITTYLVKAGATVKVVPNGHEAVEEATAALAEGNPYDVILMDMQMPELDGYGAASKLRLMKYEGPIIALTAHAMTGDRERCEKAGCDDYLTKPVNRLELVSRVAHFANKREPGPDLVSTLALDEDEDMKEILHRFVQDLPRRSSAILVASAAGDLETVKRLAHQLKGAGGGYGFAVISEAAAAVERAVTLGVEAPLLQGHIDKLARLCRSARAA